MIVSALHAMGRRFAWLVLAVSAGAIGLGLLGRYVPELDLIANARGHLIGLAIAALLALWLDYRPVLILTLGAFLTLATHSLIAQQSEFPLVGSAQAASGSRPTSNSSWTVLTLNTWHHHPDQDGLTDYLIGSGADVLVLTEFGPNKLGMLQVLETSYPYRKDCAGQWDCSIAVLSRHPFDASGQVAATEISPARVWISFGAGKDRLTVLGTQLTDALRWPRLHRLQMADLAKVARGLDGQVLIAGDFNATPWAATYEDFVAATRLIPMGRFLPSYPAGGKGLPQLAIDHMFASNEITFQQVWLGPDVRSNHRPLLARIDLAGKALALAR